MKNINLVFVKRIGSLFCSVLCLMLFFTNFIKYTSVSSLSSGGDVSMNDGVSLFAFLFNGDYEVLDSKVIFLRDIFNFSHIVMWTSFILLLISIVLLIAGLFLKHEIVSKIGSVLTAVSVSLLLVLFFDRFEYGKTVKYLDVFNWMYGLLFGISFVGLGIMFAHEEKVKGDK